MTRCKDHRKKAVEDGGYTSTLDPERALLDGAKARRPTKSQRLLVAEQAKREARRLYVQQGKPVAEIARFVGVSPNTLRSWIQREGWARDRLAHEELVYRAEREGDVIDRALALKEQLLTKTAEALKRLHVMENMLARKLIFAASDTKQVTVTDPRGQQTTLTVPKASVQEIQALVALQASIMKEIRALTSPTEPKAMAEMKRLQDAKLLREREIAMMTKGQ